MSQLELDYINGTPIFISPNADHAFSRVHAGVFDKDLMRWRFPAYAPFGQLVIADLKKVSPNLELSEPAKEQARKLAATAQDIEKRVLPEGFTFVTKPFDHQIEGLAYLLHHPRFALLWDPGTGKSKVMIDLKRALPGKRMLILTPKVTVRNWLKEIEIHAGGELKAAAMHGTVQQKRKVLEHYKEYDVLIASYGTARNLGLPRLHKETLKQIRDGQAAGAKLSDSGLQALVRAIRALGDQERQAAYVLAHFWGMPLAQIERYVAAEAAQKAQWLEDIDYDILVCDESQNIKELTSQQTKIVLALSKKATRRYLMSGTPTMGDPRHLYPQMKFLSPAIFPEDWFKFSDNYLVRSPYNKRIVTGFKNLNILNARVQRVAIRKKKEECLDLPPRHIIDLTFKLSPEQTRLYNTLVSTMAADLASFFSKGATDYLEIQNAAVLLNKLAQVSSGFLIDRDQKEGLCDGCPHLSDCVSAGVIPYTARCHVAKEAPPKKVHFLKENPKLELIDDLLDSLLADKENKVIIWGIHKAELETLAQLLTTKKLGHVRVQGSTSGNIQALIDRFNGDPNCRVYLGQIATGVGITLNAAAYTIYSSLDWSLGTYEQSIDRNYRAGQTKKTVVYRLLGEGTVDMYKAKALDEKKDISATLMNKVACTSCDQQFVCLKNKVELFDRACKYKRHAKRTIARAEMIK